MKYNILLDKKTAVEIFVYPSETAEKYLKNFDLMPILTYLWYSTENYDFINNNLTDRKRL